MIHPPAVQNAFVPFAILIVVAMRNSILQRVQQRRSCDDTAQADRGAAETQITVDGALRADIAQLPIGILLREYLLQHANESEVILRNKLDDYN